MNRLVIYMFMALVSFLPIYCIAQGYSEEDSIARRREYQVVDGVYSWYPIKYVEFEKTTLLRDSRGNLYLFPDSLVEEDDEDEEYELDMTRYSEKAIVTNGEAFLVAYDMVADLSYYMPKSASLEFDSILPENLTTVHRHTFVYECVPGGRVEWIGGISFTRLKFYPKPKGFLFVLITGIVYNDIMYNFKGHPSVAGPAPLPSRYGYYKLLIPAWEKD